MLADCIWGLMNGELLWSLVVPGYLGLMGFLGFKVSLFQSKFSFSFHQSSFKDIQGYDFIWESVVCPWGYWGSWDYLESCGQWGSYNFLFKSKFLIISKVS